MRRAFIYVAVLWALAFIFAAVAQAGTVYIKNDSTLIPQSQLEAIVPAVQTAFARDFNPAWGTNTQVALSQFPPFNSTVLSIVDSDPNVSGAFGYHDVYRGIPYGKVLAEELAAHDGSLSQTVTHELFEIAVDPFTNDAVRVSRFYFPFYLQETADPVEDTAYSYTIDGVEISDFVLPKWFRAGSAGPWDFTRYTSRALQILPGGYQIAYRRSTNSWVQLCAGGGLCSSFPTRLGA